MQISDKDYLEVGVRIGRNIIEILKEEAKLINRFLFYAIILPWTLFD